MHENRFFFFYNQQFIIQARLLTITFSKHSIQGLCVPAVVETVFRYPDDLGPGNWILIKNGLLCIIAVLALVTGSYVSMLEIVHMYTS